LGVRPGLVFGEEIAEHAFLVFGGEVDRLDLDPEHVATASTSRKSWRAVQCSVLSSSSSSS